MSTPYVQTVDGPVARGELGFTLTHEHIFLEMWSSDAQGFVGQLCDEDVLEAELAAFRAAGGGCLVDQTPGGAGRDPLGLRRMTARTGVKIVTGCGWYTEPFYPTTSRCAAPPQSPISTSARSPMGSATPACGPGSSARSERARAGSRLWRNACIAPRRGRRSRRACHWPPM